MKRQSLDPLLPKVHATHSCSRVDGYDATVAATDVPNEAYTEGEHGAERGMAGAKDTVISTNRSAVIVIYISILAALSFNSLQQMATGNLTSYITSAFHKHPLLSTASVLSSIVGGATRIPVSKIIDTWGRGEGFVAMALLTTLGLALTASCTNIGLYSVAQVLYWIGFDGMGYVTHVYIADVTTLENRAIAFAFEATPYLVTTFAGPAVAQAFYDYANWRLAFAFFAIATPIVCAPVIIMLFRHRSNGPRFRIADRLASGVSWGKFLRSYSAMFDVPGMVLFVLGLSLLLLPLTLNTYQALIWQSPSNITLLVVGTSLLVVFALWEHYGATNKLLPFELLEDRSVLGACLLAGLLFMSFSFWSTYSLPFLQVVHDLSIQKAGYISNIFNICSCVFAIVIGGLIRLSGRFKWIALLVLPIRAGASYFQIYTVQPHASLCWLVMAQVVNAFATSALHICQETAIMAAAQQQIAVVVALLMLSSNIGGAIGTALAGAIWTATLPRYLEDELPDRLKDEAGSVFGDMARALEFPMGSVEREAVIRAYCRTMTWLSIASLATVPLAVAFVCMWRNLPVREEASGGDERAEEEAA